MMVCLQRQGTVHHIAPAARRAPGKADLSAIRPEAILEGFLNQQHAESLLNAPVAELSKNKQQGRLAPSALSITALKGLSLPTSFEHAKQ